MARVALYTVLAEDFQRSARRLRGGDHHCSIQRSKNVNYGNYGSEMVIG